MSAQHVAKEIKRLLEKRQKDISLSFIEEGHIYSMMGTNGKMMTDISSVSKIIKKFEIEFDTNGMASIMSKGDPEAKKKLLESWKLAGDLSTNLGSRVHYELEIEALKRFGIDKEVRQPIFEINDEQKIISDKMIKAGKKFLDLMEERGAVLVDTETVLGDPILNYTGQPDKTWVIVNKQESEVGLLITDWKTNKRKNFEVQRYTKKLKYPFSNYPSTSLGKYYLQLPLYGKLIKAMLQGTEYENINLLGNIIVLLKEDGTFEEFRVPKPISDTILKMDLSKY